MGLIPVQSADATPNKDIDDLGLQPVAKDPPDSKPMEDHVASNIKAHVDQLKEDNKDADGKQKPIEANQEFIKHNPPQHPAETVLQALDAGWQGSFGGLFHRGKMPDTVVPEDAPMAMQIASMISGWAGDLPAMAAGMESGAPAGAAIGAAAGTLVAPGPGTIAGGTVGAIAGGFGGAFAAPAMMRKMLIDHYQQNGDFTAGDFAARAVGTAAAGLKAGTVGALTGLTGVAGGFLAGPVAQKIAEVAAMTSVAKGLEGQLPEWKDFANAAIVIGGFHAAEVGLDKLPEVKDKLAEMYKQRGVKPTEVAEAVQSDPALKGQILSSNIEGKHIEMPSEHEQAEKGLPQFTESDLAKEPGKVEDAVNPRPDYSKVSDNPKLSDSEKEVLSRIGEQTKVKEPFIDPHEFYKNYFDFLHQLKVAIDENGGKELPADQNAYVLGRTMAAYSGKVRNFYEEGTYDFKTRKVNGEGFQDIIDDAKAAGGGTIEKLNAYAMSKRAIELSERGHGSTGIWQGIDIDTAEKVVRENPQMEKIQQRFVQAGNRTLKYYKDAGMISDQSFKNIVEANQEHIPFRKILEPDPITGKIPGSVKGIKEIGDSELEMTNPVVQRVQDMDWMIKAAEVNRMKSAMIDHLAGPGGTDADPEHLQLVETNNYRRKLGAGELDRMVDGKQQVYKANPGLVEVANRFEGQEGNLGLFTKLAKPITDVTKAGYMLDPSFALRHVWRAATAGFTYSQTGQLPLIHPILALGDFMGKSDVYRQWLFDGGAQGSLEPINKNWLESKVLDLDKDTPFIKQAWNLATSPFQNAHVFIALADNLTKLAEYKRSPGILNEEGSLNENATQAQRMQAAFNAREVTPDYSRIGAKMQAITARTAFYNADLQGSDRFLRAMKDDTVSTTLKSIAMYTVPGLLTWYATHDKEWYKGLPHWQKDLYSNFDVYDDKQEKLPGGQSPATIFKLPQSFTQGLIFGSGPQRVLDAYADHDPTAMKDFVKDLAEHVAIGAPVPDVLKQAIQLQTNYNLFTHNPIIPYKLTKEVPEMQYKEYTSDTAKALAKMVGAVPGIGSMHFPGEANRNMTPGSPMMWDYMIRSTGGPVGQFGVYLTDKALKAAGLAPESIKPVATLNELPFLREFFARYPNTNDQRVEDFLTRSEGSQDVLNSMQDAKKRGNIPELKKLTAQYVDSDPVIKPSVEFIHQRNAMIQNLQRLPMDPTQKRQLQDGMYLQMIQAAQTGTKALDRLEKNRETNKGSK